MCKKVQMENFDQVIGFPMERLNYYDLMYTCKALQNQMYLRYTKPQQQPSYFYHKGQSQGNKAINLPVIQKGIISGKYRFDYMKSPSLTVQSF